MKYLEIPNWQDFQHYKDRNPPWIKLHNQVLEDYEFTCLPDCTKAHLLCIWMLAARTNNKIPANPQWIANKIGATEQVDIDLLLSSGFLVYQGDSTVLADCSSDCTVTVPLGEERREEERRGNYALSLDWEPNNQQWEAMSFKSGLGVIDPKPYLAEFNSYYQGKGSNNEAYWQGRLVSWIKRENKNGNKNNSQKQEVYI